MLEQVVQQADDFDIIHFHVDYLHFPLSRATGILNVTTLHGRLDIPDLVPLYQEFREMPVVSISDSQREPLSWANWQGTVYHGLPLELHRYHEQPGEYLAFLGRISPEKRVDRAIEVAKRVQMPLKIAAKVDETDEKYFEEEIKPLLDHPLIEFVGEVGEDEKEEFLGNAYALLFPINWPEPFGLVMIEAMACGTPIIAYDRGSVTEVLDHGRTGFIVNNLEEAVDAVQRVPTIERKQCRRAFEDRFSAARMAQDYVAIYQQLVDDKQMTAEKGYRVAKESRLSKPPIVQELYGKEPYGLEPRSLM
jgi:glycosyltransferase involved in cell wall biosynthesis